MKPIRSMELLADAIQHEAALLEADLSGSGKDWNLVRRRISKLNRLMAEHEAEWKTVFAETANEQ